MAAEKSSNIRFGDGVVVIFATNRVTLTRTHLWRTENNAIISFSPCTLYLFYIRMFPYLDILLLRCCTSRQMFGAGTFRTCWKRTAVTTQCCNSGGDSNLLRRFYPRKKGLIA